MARKKQAGEGLGERKGKERQVGEVSSPDHVGPQRLAKRKSLGFEV